MKLPNLITVFRLLMVPLFILPLTAEPPMYIFSLVVFLVASVSDAADGAIARKTGTVTATGRFLDPLADKLLIISGFIMLTVLGRVPLILTQVVLARDILIGIGWLSVYLFTGIRTIKPSVLGKTTTIFQMGVITTGLAGWGVVDFFIPAAGVFTALSGIHYLARESSLLARSRR